MTDRLVSLEHTKGSGSFVTMQAPGGDTLGNTEPIEANRALLSRNDPVALAALIRSRFADLPSEEKPRINEVSTAALAGEQDLMHRWAQRLARTAPARSLYL